MTGSIAITAPKHIALVPDGNRRWAKEHNLEPWQGHEKGAEVLDSFFDWCIRANIPIVTIYTLSTENLLNRTKEEVKYLYDIYVREFGKRLDDERIFKNQIKVNFLGNTDTLPISLKNIIEELVEKSKTHTKGALNFLMPYGGRSEILHAAKRIIKDVLDQKISISQLSEDMFSNYLFTAGMPDPDIVVRTVEKRLSNIMPWQSTYSEMFFVDKYWPEFTRQDFDKIISEYYSRKRNFGK